MTPMSKTPARENAEVAVKIVGESTIVVFGVSK